MPQSRQIQGLLFMTNVLYSLYSKHSYSFLFFQTVILFRRYKKLTWTLRSSYWNSLKCVRAFQMEMERTRRPCFPIGFEQDIAMIS